MSSLASKAIKRSNVTHRLAIPWSCHADAITLPYDRTQCSVSALAKTRLMLWSRPLRAMAVLSLAIKYQAEIGVARSRLLHQRPRLVSLDIQGTEKKQGHGVSITGKAWATDRRVASPVQNIKVQVQFIQRVLKTTNILCGPGVLRERLTRVHNLEDSDKGQHTFLCSPQKISKKY